MDVSLALANRAQVEAFQRRHRVALLTLLFTDIVGSVRLKQELGDEAGVGLIQRHHALVKEVLSESEEGEAIGTAGDSFFVVFAKPSDAVRFSLALQARVRSLAKEVAWPLKDRIGIHVGEVVVQDRAEGTAGKDLYGLQVDICARVMSVAEGEQTLMTRSVFDNARQVLKGREIPGVSGLVWLNHGPYLLKGVEEPLEVCEVGESGLAVLKPPPDSEKVRRYATPDSEPVLGWRPAVGQVVPGTRWVLMRQLGEGGFGEVWLGCHETLKEERVFKFCFRADRVRSLKREVTLFKLMRERIGPHPHIVGVQDVNLEEPPFYLVMEYAPGQDLRAWAQAQGDLNQVPLSTRLEIVAQVADALQAAHQAGVVHRDIKPGNILIAECGVRSAESGGSAPGLSRPSAVSVKLTDFGIGQVVSQEILSQMTRMGFTQTIMTSGSTSLTGTQLYMAPELLAQKPASAQSDIYSLGVVLYQLLVGDLNRPLTTDWAKEIADPLLREDLEKCFAGRPEERFASAAQLAENLRSLPQRQAELRLREAALAARERAAYHRGLARATAVALFIIAIMASLVFYARDQAATARAAAERAARSEQQTRRQHSIARRHAEESRQRLVRQFVDKGIVALEAGDALGSLPWFAEALRLDQQNPEAAQTHRARFAAVLRECPRLLQFWLHDGKVSQAVFSLDGRQLVTLSEGTLRAWDVATGQARPNELKAATNVLVFGATGKRLWALVEDDEGARRLHDAQSGEALTPPLKDPDWVVSEKTTILDYGELADGRKLVAAGFVDSTAELWDVAARRAIAPAFWHPWGLTTVALSPTGGWLATGGSDNSVRLWRWSPVGSPAAPMALTNAPEPILVVEHSDEITCLGFSPDGARLVTGSGDGSVRVLATESGKAVVAPLQHRSRVNVAAFGPDGQQLITASEDGTARVWNTETGEPLTPLLKHTSPVRCGALSHDGQEALTGCDDGTCRLWALHRTEALPLQFRHRGPVRCAAFSPDRQRLVTASDDFTARVWELKTRRPLPLTLPHKEAVLFAIFSPDGRSVFTASADDTARVWDAATGAPLCPPLEAGGAVISAAFCPDGTTVAAAWWSTPADRGANLELRAWKVSTGQPLGAAIELRRAEGSIQFSLDGQVLLSVSSDGTLHAWDTASGKPRDPATLPPQRLACSFVSPDRGLIAVTEGDNLARVRQVGNRKAVSLPLQHQGTINRLAFDPRGRWLLTASADHTARVWDARSGLPITPSLRHDAAVLWAEWSADSEAIVTASEDGVAQVWDLAPQPGASENLVMLAELLSGHRLDETGALLPLDAAALGERWSILTNKWPAEFNQDFGKGLAWHREQAEAAEAAWHWSAAARYLSALLRAAPEQWELLARRAQVYAHLARWQEAGHDFAQAAALGGPPGRLLPFLADVQLIRGDTGGFADTCARLLRAPGLHDSASLADLAGWICALAPNRPEVVAQAQRMLAPHLAAQPQDPKLLASAGALCYRAGDFEQACQRLEQAVKASAPGSHSPALVFLAMAQCQANQSEAARRTLDSARLQLSWLVRWSEAKLASGSAPPWELDLELRMLIDEAEDLLQSRR